MAYISIDPEGVDALITLNENWVKDVGESRDAIASKNQQEGSPCGLMNFTMGIALHTFTLLGYVNDLSVRLDAAEQANTLGITMPAESGRIVYYLPDGTEDTTANVEQYNQKSVERARQHAEELKNFDGSEQDWKDLSAEVQKDWDNPVYANAVIETLGPEGFVDGPTTVAEASGSYVYGGRPRGGWSPGEWRGGEEAAGLYAHLLSTASVTWSEEKGNEFGGQVAEAVKTGGAQRVSSLDAILGSSVEKDVNGDGVTENVGLDYSDAMLLTLGRSLEGYEAEPLDPKDAYAGRKTASAVPGIVHAMTGNYGAFDAWIRVDDTESGSSSDGPEAAHDRAKSLVEKNDIGVNTWTDDWSILGYQHAMSGPELTMEDEKMRMATVAGIMNGLGGTPQPVDMSPQARGLIGDTLGMYPEGVDASAIPGNNDGITIDVSGEGYPANGNSVAPVITDQALSNLVGQVEQDEGASERLGQKMSAYRDQRYQWALESYSETRDAKNLRTVIAEESTTNGFFAGATANLLEAKAEANDENDAFRATLLKGVANLIPIPVAGSLGDVAVSGWEIGHENHEDVARQGNLAVANQAKDMGVDAVTARLINAGLYSPEEQQTIAAQEKSNVAPIIDENGNFKPFDQTSEDKEDIDVALTKVAGYELNALDNRQRLSVFSGYSFDEGYDAANPGGSVRPDGSGGDEEDEG